MKNAAVIISAIVVGIALIYLIIAILPFLIAAAGILLIHWMMITFINGEFGLRK
jgi:hypothetical protein